MRIKVPFVQKLDKVSIKLSMAVAIAATYQWLLFLDGYSTITVQRQKHAMNSYSQLACCSLGTGLFGFRETYFSKSACTAAN